MFAPRPAKSPVRPVSGSTHGFAHQSNHGSTQRDISPQPDARIHATPQGARPDSVAAGKAPHNGGRDFSGIPVFSADRPSQGYEQSSLIPLSIPRVLQPKLAVGAIDDPLEREADAVADHVMRTPDFGVSGPSLRPQTGSVLPENTDDEGHGLRAKYSDATTHAAREAPAIVHEVLRSPGQPIDPATLADLGPRIGHDFSSVRIHADTVAAQSAGELNANAYTVGEHIVFGAGQYRPNTASGRRLLSHELTHFVQQSRGLAPWPTVLQRQPKPNQQPTQTIQGDVPGENPATFLPPPASGFSAEIRIDGDGDQYKELALQMVEKEFWPSSSPSSVGPVKRLLVKITQISSGEARQVEFILPMPTFGGQLFPLVKEVTEDGDQPGSR